MPDCAHGRVVCHCAVLKTLRSSYGKVLRWIVNNPTNDWSRSRALLACGWDEFETVVMRRIVMSARNVILSKQSKKLYDLLVDRGGIRNYDHLADRSKLCKSWKIRSTRALRLLGYDFIDEDKSKLEVKNKLKKLNENQKAELTCIFYGRRTEGTLPNQIWV